MKLSSRLVTYKAVSRAEDTKFVQDFDSGGGRESSIAQAADGDLAGPPRCLLQKGCWAPESSQAQTEPWESGGTGAQGPEGVNGLMSQMNLTFSPVEQGWDGAAPLPEHQSLPSMGRAGLPASPRALCTRARGLVGSGDSHVLVDANPFPWGPATVGLPKTIRCSGESNLAARGLSDMYL